MIRIVGSDVTQLRETPFTTGVQRVMIETHKSLAYSLPKDKFDLHGFSTLDLPGKKYLESPYLATDPVLAAPLVTLEDLDIALLLDLNLALSFKEILLLKRQRNLPVISVIHDIIPILNPEWFPGENSLTKRYFRDFLQKTLAISDHLILCSNKVKQDIQNLGWKIDKPIHIFPLGASHIVKNARERADEIPTIVYVSTIEPRKGHMDLLGAFELLRSRGIQVRLEIVGRPGWLCRDILERMTANPDYGTLLKWHSKLSDEGVAELFNRASVSVAASFDEGFGLGIEEALAREVMVLARRIPVFAERPNPNVYYFDGGAESLATELISALDREWVPLEEKSVRTMRDFGDDITTLIHSLD